MNNILILDSNHLIFNIFSALLPQKGYEIFEAENGQDCLEIAGKNSPEYIFTDTQMPKTTGFDLANALEKIECRAKIVRIDTRMDGNKQLDDKFDSKLQDQTLSLRRVIEHFSQIGGPTTKQVLVVDDERVLRGLLGTIFKKEGYEISEAKNGLECIDKASRSQFQAIFMDVRMPIMDGIEALEKLRAFGNDTPVIMMSGFGPLCSTQDAKSRGANAFLAKPFKPSDAINCLKENA